MPVQKIGRIEVNTFQRPPADFDPLRANNDELQRYGLPRRPDEEREPQKALKWVKAFRNYSDHQHITPEFRERPDRYHKPNRRNGFVGVANATSDNWSGSVLFIGPGDSFTAITGQWTVPDAYSPNGNTCYSSAWLGIDGDGSPDVMQAGTETDSDGTCYAWFEWYPNFSIQISNFPVKPGDMVYLVLYVTDPTTAWASMWNLTSKIYTNFSFTAPDGIQLVGNCAEAIVERPSINGVLAELPRYGEVYFDECTAYTKNGNQFDITFGTPISMVADDGVTVISIPTFEGNTDMINCTYAGV